MRGRPTRKRQTFRSTWDGLAGDWRRRDMTKPRLAYAVYQARRPVTWGALVPRETGAQDREVRRACQRTEPGSQALNMSERVRKPTHPHGRNQTATEEPPDRLRRGVTHLGASDSGGAEWP